MNTDTSLVINGQSMAAPVTLKSICDPRGNLMTTNRYLCAINNIAYNAKRKLSDLKKQIGDKAKDQIKAYNSAKLTAPAFSKAVGIASMADPSLKQSHKFDFNAKGEWIGTTVRSRKIRGVQGLDAILAKLAAAEARVQELEANKLPAPAKA